MLFAGQNFLFGGSKLIIGQDAGSVQACQLLQASHHIRSGAGSSRRCGRGWWWWRISFLGRGCVCLLLLRGNLILKIGNLFVLHVLSLLALGYSSAGVVAGAADGRRP